MAYNSSELVFHPIDHPHCVRHTGVDQYHCMFHDDDTGLVATSAFSGTVVTDLSKRKVVQYLVGEYGDSYDCAAENGHGTHVSSGPKIDAALILDTCSPYTRLFLYFGRLQQVLPEDSLRPTQ